MATGASSTNGTIRSLYRTLHRELGRGSKVSRTYLQRRQDALPQYARQLIQPAAGQPALPERTVQRRLDNLCLLLTHSRVHGELLARYNPVYGKSEQERIRATANRVGLDVPRLFEGQAEGQDKGEGIDEKYRS